MTNIIQLLELLSTDKISSEETLQYITEQDLNLILNNNFKNTKNNLLLTKGESINSGDASGYLVTNKLLADTLFKEAKDRGTKINIIYAPEKGDITDFSNIKECSGFFTEQKGRTTFCSLQASCEGKPTIGNVTCNRNSYEKSVKLSFKFLDESMIELDTIYSELVFNNNHIVKEGELISISGQEGKIYKGLIESDSSKISKIYHVLSKSLVELKNEISYKNISDTPTYKEHKDFLIDYIKDDAFKGFQKLLKHCYQNTNLKIFSTSHTPETLAYSSLIASDIYYDNNEIIINNRNKDFGLGLLRDERIWNSIDEIDLLRLLFLGEKVSKDYYQIKEQYVNTLTDKLYNVFKIGTGNVAVIRLLCMPLTMLFTKEFDISRFCKQYNLDTEVVKSEIQKISGEKEAYHGFRGVRVTVQRKDIAELWCQSVIKAAQKAHYENSLEKVQILLSMVTLPQEVSNFVEVLNKVLKQYDCQNIFSGLSIMVETTGAYILIDDFMKIHKEQVKLNGLLFGGNDFTAACLNMNRSDSAATIIPTYIEKGLFEYSPFQSLNTQLVGKAILDTLDKVNNQGDCLIGLGGEIAGDWNSVQWLAKNAACKGLNYISTPPNRMIYSLIASAKAIQNYHSDKLVIE